MKITEENLKKYDIYITRNGNIRSRKYRKTFYKKICPQCGEEFLARVRNDRKGQGNSEEYCSHECASIARSKPFYIANGYKRVWEAKQSSRNGKLEHRKIVERVLGRVLHKDEVVHHINGKKLDNRNCNLLVCDRAFHKWLHQQMSRKYMEEHFSDL